LNIQFDGLISGSASVQNGIRKPTGFLYAAGLERKPATKSETFIRVWNLLGPTELLGNQAAIFNHSQQRGKTMKEQPTKGDLVEWTISTPHQSRLTKNRQDSIPVEAGFVRMSVMRVDKTCILTRITSSSDSLFYPKGEVGWWLWKPRTMAQVKRPAGWGETAQVERPTTIAGKTCGSPTCVCNQPDKFHNR